MSKTPILEVKNLGIDFGGLSAVNNFYLDIYPNEIVGLIGPNGAGKTTVFNLLTKIYEQTRGDIVLCGQNLKGLDTVKANIIGISRTFQNIRLFQNETVIDNVVTGLYNQTNYSLFDALIKSKKYRKVEKEIYDKAMNLLEIFNLKEDAYNLANSLPYGKQRRLEILRALSTNPKLLLLDEPAAGMNPSETLELMNSIKLIKEKFDVSILLIEHDMKFVMGICERIIVLNFGTILVSGTPEEIVNNPSVISAYLGGN